MKGILASLLIKLGLDSKEFEQGVDNAKQKTNAFAGGMKALGGVIAGAFSVAAITAFLNKVKNATDTLSTNVDVFLGGITEASNEFFRSVSSWDFSNFIDNMKEAVRVGKEYVATLDDIESRQRAMTIAEADARAEIVALEETLRNATLSDEERINAGQKRVKIEEELAKKRTDIAKQNYENELKLATLASKLSSEQLIKLAADFNSEKKIRAEAYNERFKSLRKTMFTEKEIANILKNEGFSSDVADYAENLRNLGNVTDEQMNKVVKAYSEMKAAEVSGRESIKRIITTINTLLNAGKQKGLDEQKAMKELTGIATKALIPAEEEPLKVSDWAGQPILLAEQQKEAQSKIVEGRKVFNADMKATLDIGIEQLQADLDREKEIQLKRLEQWNNFREEMANLVVDFGINVVEEFGQSIGEMIASGNFDFKDFGKNILAGIGGFISQLGKMLIGLGIASEAFQALLKSAFTNPVSAGLAIAAGAALVLLGGAIQGAAKAGPSGSSSSGSVSTPSYSKAGGTSQGMRAQDNKVVFEIQGTKLVGVLSNVQRKNLNMA